MFYVKNIPGWERAIRGSMGVALIIGGLMLFGFTLMGWVVAGSGIMAALTGFSGFCPMCALAGRKLDKANRS